MIERFKGYIKNTNWLDVLLVIILIIAIAPAVMSEPDILIYLAIAGIFMYISKRI